jgi:hypothetical protein
MKHLRWFWASALLCVALALSRSPEDRERRLPAGSPHLRRDEAIRRGLRFIYATARIPGNFEDYGDDFLWCFSSIAATSADPEVKYLAQRMGQERARRWRIENPSVPDSPSADEVVLLVSGSYGADRLGVVDGRMRQDLVGAARRYRAEDYLDFDPSKEPPPCDIPERCRTCGKYNHRGIRVCQRCGSALTMKTPFAVLLDTLVIVYAGDSYGVRLGAHLEDVTQWLPKLRPYRGREAGANRDWWDLSYAITHVIYALNGYSQFRLNPAWLPDEWEFLRANLKETIDTADPETAGEYLDTLKSFGLTEADPLIRTGMEFILSRQNPDGSWGDPRSDDGYSRYHPTWTAIDGLRDYAWRGEGVTSQKALRKAQGPRSETAR